MSEQPSAAMPTHVPQPGHRCRHLTVKGLQCRSRAVRGHDYCFSHKHFRHPECPEKGSKIVIPLLEDLATVQVFLSQIAHGLLSGRLTSAEARSLSYTCQVASNTFARPVAHRPKRSLEDLPISEPVYEPAEAPDGTILGPLQRYHGDATKPEERWCMGRYAYHAECRRNGWPIPEDPYDYPVTGWLTPEEEWATKGNPEAIEALFKAKLTLAREQAAAREAEESKAAIAAGLPDPHAGKIRKCPRGVSFCGGPQAVDRCDACDEMGTKPKPPVTATGLCHESSAATAL